MKKATEASIRRAVSLMAGGGCEFRRVGMLVVSYMEHWRRPRSRKARIRAKWAARPENWRPAENLLEFTGERGDSIACTPDVRDRIISELRRRGSKTQFTSIA